MRMKLPRIIPERLVERIAAAGMSYSAVARELGVKQPTITRLANGEQGSTARIDQLARIVGTTPSYLTGETDVWEPDVGVSSDLSFYERQLLQCVSTIGDAERSALLTIAKSLADRGGRG